MYLHLGPTTVIRDCEIIGIFDLDITSQSYRTRQYLNRAEKAGQVINAAEEQLPKSFVLCQKRGEKGQRVYLAQPNSGTLQKRLKGRDTVK
ncbi:MAG: DUF370 domain-containing protein [Oscillospiraceae bacterium]|nr:DUF370 domain-containing protein [Oscillospiraceae bacterium]